MAIIVAHEAWIHQVLVHPWVKCIDCFTLNTVPISITDLTFHHFGLEMTEQHPFIKPFQVSLYVKVSLHSPQIIKVYSDDLWWLSHSNMFQVVWFRSYLPSICCNIVIIRNWSPLKGQWSLNEICQMFISTVHLNLRSFISPPLWWKPIVGHENISWKCKVLAVCLCIVIETCLLKATQIKLNMTYIAYDSPCKSWKRVKKENTVVLTL